MRKINYLRQNAFFFFFLKLNKTTNTVIFLQIWKCESQDSLVSTFMSPDQNLWVPLGDSQKSCYMDTENYCTGFKGVVGWCEGAVYLTSPGRQLILAYSWARPAILVVGKGRGGMFLFLLFLHFHSCSSFFPVPLFHLLYPLFSPLFSLLFLFSLSLGDDTKWPSRVDVSLNPNTVKKKKLYWI